MKYYIFFELVNNKGKFELDTILVPENKPDHIEAHMVDCDGTTLYHAGTVTAPTHAEAFKIAATKIYKTGRK